MNSIPDNSKAKRLRTRNPIQQLVNTFPQLAISAAILLFTLAAIPPKPEVLSGTLFYLSVLAGIGVSSVFTILQLKKVEYRNWQQNPTTRQYIQIATLSTILSFTGLSITFWSTYGLLSPVLVIIGFIFIMSCLTVITAFMS
ncbi:hypothetical protein BDF20DRAFT_910414 [Mycotypha africana]|uniref:uncharacterized protein n=1 Tax=Mycotypha africana TaxID=64632 RepID=UPI0023008ACE|nr:uncharacterized protein BDF20DRAFT_910414 [Mycotypha africana]KAI8987869.1 hypothetical protein BDF20DRAFT_910414 [Mycotypha africana]